MSRNSVDISTIHSFTSFTGTQTSSSTIPGLGSLSGKAIKRLGEVVLNGVDYVLVNRQLSRIEARFKKDGTVDDKNETEARDMCGILLELTHPGYTFSVKTRALCIIMERIGAMKFKALAEALVENSTSTFHRHLSTIIECLSWNSRGIEGSLDTATDPDTVMTKKIASRQAAGYEAYMTATINIHSALYTEFTILSSCTAFILYLTFIATIGSKDHVRMIFELVNVRFLEVIGLFDPFKSRSQTMPGRLLMHIIALKLDPVHDQDSDAVASINNTLDDLHPYSSPTMNDDDDGVWGRLEALNSGHSHSTSLTDVISDAIEFIKAESLSIQQQQQPLPSKSLSSQKISGLFKFRRGTNSPGTSVAVDDDFVPLQSTADDENISAPWNFQHNVHVDETLTGLLPEWTVSLAKAGFTEEEIAAIYASKQGGPVTPGNQVPYQPYGYNFPRSSMVSITSSTASSSLSLSTQQQQQSPPSKSSSSQKISGLFKLRRGTNSSSSLPIQQQQQQPPLPKSSSSQKISELFKFKRGNGMSATVDDDDIAPSQSIGDDENISIPWNFQHNLHVDEAYNGLPPSWTLLLAQAGFTDEEIAAINARKQQAGMVTPGNEVPYQS